MPNSGRPILSDKISNTGNKLDNDTNIHDTVNRVLWDRYLNFNEKIGYAIKSVDNGEMKYAEKCQPKKKRPFSLKGLELFIEIGNSRAN